MNIHIEGTRSFPRAYVMARLKHALERVSLSPVTARVSFSDVNGPKGGEDVRCAIVVRLPRRRATCVVRLATTPRLAFDQSYDVVVRELERARERTRRAHRHPKKYYAAKRVWRERSEAPATP